MSHEVYVAYEMLEYMKQQHKVKTIQKLYQKYINELLIKLMIQQKGILALAAVKQYQEAFFNPKIQLVKNYLKKISTFDKVKKVFILQQHYLNQSPHINNKQQKHLSQQQQQQSFDVINYSDFRCNLTNKNEFQHPQKTLNFIKNSYNNQIYNKIFTTKSIARFIIKLSQIKKQINRLVQKNIRVGFNFDKFRPLLSEICKIVYIKKELLRNDMKSNNHDKDINLLIQLIKNIQNVQNLLNSFEKQIIFGQKMQQQHQKMDQQLSINIISMKSSQKLLQQQQNQKNQTKTKILIKKTKTKRKIQKSTQNFERQQKTIIQQIESNIINSQTKTTHSCLVCKSQSQQQMIYLVNISYHNHQRILKLGSGTLCFSIQSCYHTIDYPCYKKLIKKSSQQIKCPFCSFVSNTFLPLDYKNKKYTSQSILRLSEVIDLLKQFQQISIMQQIIKSFYHFALLSYLDPQRTLNKRLQIYKIVLNILKSHIQLSDLNKVFERYMNNSINLMPQIKIDNKVFNISENQINQLEESQLQQLMAMLNGITGAMNHNTNNDDNNNMEEQHQQGIISKAKGFIQNIKNKIIGGKQQSKIQKRISYNIIMQQTFNRLFQYLGFKPKLKQQQQKMKMYEQKYQKMQLQQQQHSHSHPLSSLPTSVQICLTTLFTHKYHLSSIYQLNQQNNLFTLRNLPLNFIPLSKLTKCDYCQQISSQICICLLCDQFKLCKSNCMTKNDKFDTKKQSSLQKAGCINHTAQYHGEEALFLTLSTCTVFYVNKDKIKGISLGCVYKNQYGEVFNMKQDWEQYYLDQNVLNKIKIKFLHQE